MAELHETAFHCLACHWHSDAGDDDYSQEDAQRHANESGHNITMEETSITTIRPEGL